MTSEAPVASNGCSPSPAVQNGHLRLSNAIFVVVLGEILRKFAISRNQRCTGEIDTESSERQLFQVGRRGGTWVAGGDAAAILPTAELHPYGRPDLQQTK